MSRSTCCTVSVSPDVPELGTFSGDLPGVYIPQRSAIWYSLYLTAPVGMVIDLIDWSETKARKSAAIAWRMDDSKVKIGSIVRDEFLWCVENCGIFRSIRPSAPS